MAAVPTIPEIISYAEICQYLGVVDINNQNLLRGGALNKRDPRVLYMTRRAVAWEQSFYPSNPTLPSVAYYLYNLCGRYLFQAEQILGTGSGIIVIPGTGAGGTLQGRQVEFIIGDVDSPMSAGDTELVLTYSDIVGGSVSVFQNNILVANGSYDPSERFAYTIVYTTTSVTITFNYPVQDTELYNINFLQLIPI